MAVTVHEDMEGVENEPVRPKVSDSKGILKQNREFLDFFWDIAKPERDIRLKAIEGLIEYLKKTEKSDELQYSLKRLVDGLSHSREDARTGYSLALAQLLSVFEDIQLQTILDQIKQKNNLQGLQKKQIRNVAFGNFFGVLALSQSTRLSKEPQVLLECVRLLQRISQFSEHLRDLPRKTMVDLLAETSQEVFEEMLLGALQSDLTSALSTPEHLELLLVAMQKFPEVLKPKKLKKLLGSTTVITEENIPKLVDVLKTAANSVRKERLLPPVAIDLLEVSLREDRFDLFWNDIILKGLMNEQPGPLHYMCFRLVGSALTHLSVPQLRQVLSSEVMRHYGEHVVVAQQPDRFKIAPEMDVYVKQFLQGCADPDKQLAVMVGFTQLTNQGYPVIPSFWKVVECLQPAALERYVDWLKSMFLQPQLENLLDFTTRRQRENQEASAKKSDESVLRLRKWILPRLTSIVENHQVKKEEDLVMDIARFIFFHAFFTAKKSTPDIPETEVMLSVALDEKTRAVVFSSFFGLLQHLNHLPVQGESSEEAAPKKLLHGVTADGSSWLYCLVQYGDVLLSQNKYIQCVQPFSAEQKSSWDGMIKSVESLQKKAKKSATPEVSAFQLLFLLVGINLFKAPEESVDLIQDIQSCMEKVNARKSKRKKKTAEEEEEPHWVEVLMEILLSLLSQPSRLIRQVCKTVFGRICPHVNQGAITAILDVLDPSKETEDGALVVTDEKETDNTRKRKNESDDEEDDEDEATDQKVKGDEEDEEEEESDSDDDDNINDDEEVDPNFRLELMKVLQGQNAMATETDKSDDEELDDDAMMKLDGSIASLFAEHKKRIQAKKDEREKLRKEKALIRDFKIKVLDLVEVFLDKQSANPLVLGMIEPLLTVIESGMSSGKEQQEVDFLRKAADIFKNTLCRGKQYCKNVDDRKAELHDLLERLLTRAQKLSDSAVALYYFSAALYMVKVLRGVPPEGGNKQEPAESKGKAMGNLDVERVTGLFREALVSFMTRRKSPLTGAMFIDLFNRLPIFSSNLLDTLMEYITGGVREHQQAQACAIMLRGVQSREIQQLLAGPRWTELCQKTMEKLTESLGQGLEVKNKIVQEKVIKALELSLFLVKNIRNQKLEVNTDPIQVALQSMSENHDFHKSGQMEDLYWSVMKLFGVQKPKIVKAKKADEVPSAEQTPETEAKKKKGFLPESKKRKNRKMPAVVEGKDAAPQPSKPATEAPGGEGEPVKKKKKKNKKKNKKRKHPEGEAASDQSPAKKPKMPNQSPAGKPKTEDQLPGKKEKTKQKGNKKKGNKGAGE
ncbi:myb-binding protein 1A-like protein isoform X2 [Alosa sapidissima]|uniref:myb-binding protein 1A-like protein isoform X2 n=1 Tax=Alosa sapidissima TaxID=34773 RepID=UPI001C084F6C|nr:myb-binding protein 1A-like protein isoform X2 [Alosa sapidissima]